MKSLAPVPRRVRAACLALFASVMLAAPLAARIGDRQGQIEDRLLTDGTAQRLMPPDAIAFEDSLRSSPGPNPSGRRGVGFRVLSSAQSSTSFDISSIDALLWQSLDQSPPQPGSDGVVPRPPEFPEYIYFKTDDGTAAAAKMKNAPGITGWLLRVFLYKSLSGLEIYHRIGTPLTDSEIAAILSANRGSSVWTHNTAGPSDTVLLTGDLGNASFIGYDYERADGLIRAKHVGNDLVLFSTDLDHNLLEIKVGLEKAAADSSNQRSPATSTRGF